MSQLTYTERCQISILLKRGDSPSRIAQQLQRNRSVIYRELKRNRDHDTYHEAVATQKAHDRRCRKPSKMTSDLQTLIEEKLKAGWSPDQISGRLRKEHAIKISHETIYKHIRKDKLLGGELYKNLRHRGKKYHHRSPSGGKGCIPNRVDIDQRPAIVETKSRFGDFELDTIIGAEHDGAIVSIVDRYSKWTTLVKVDRRTASKVRDGIIDALTPFKGFVHTLTSDNGKEFACHEEIAKSLGASFFFAKPYHSWERGLNEHTNGLVRQYMPKGEKFSNHRQEDLDHVAFLLNQRPRKILGFSTPQEILNASITRPALQG